MNFNVYYSAIIASLLAVLVFAWVVYSGVFIVKGISQPLTDKVTDRFEQTSPQSELNYDLRKVLKSGLFKADTQIKRKSVVAKKTSLRLKLEGIIAADNNQISRAVIRSNQKKAIAYKIGDKIEGTNAELSEVENARVLIERAGVLESLELERKKIETNSGNKRPEKL